MPVQSGCAVYELAATTYRLDIHRRSQQWCPPGVAVVNQQTYGTHLSLKALRHAPEGWLHSASLGSPSRSGGHMSAPPGCAAGSGRWRTRSPSECLPMAEPPPGPPPARHTGLGLGKPRSGMQHSMAAGVMKQCCTTAVSRAAQHEPTASAVEPAPAACRHSKRVQLRVVQ